MYYLFYFRDGDWKLIYAGRHFATMLLVELVAKRNNYETEWLGW